MFKDSTGAQKGQAIHDFITKIKQNFSGAREHCAALGASRVISAFRRNKNLKGILVHTDLNKKETGKEALRLSGIGFIRLPHIFNPQSRIGFNVDQVLLPTASNVIYAVRYRTCRKLYVGETGNQLQLRIRQHLYMITSGKGTSVLYVHFKLHGPHGLQSLGLESNRQWRAEESSKSRVNIALLFAGGGRTSPKVLQPDAVSRSPDPSYCRTRFGHVRLIRPASGLLARHQTVVCASTFQTCISSCQKYELDAVRKNQATHASTDEPILKHAIRWFNLGPPPVSAHCHARFRLTS
ncbi:hypothetical protein EYF80_044185 [Liparis tanakae]|uniref:GIY-YIG domain-containing protein n=1 Tax=Liparis tanakae TaxID=230148 RepID=A0A4Z2FWK0_9TELE|nr:hypothetical protein EYF80_044185 [Liparis tanakae]